MTMPRRSPSTPMRQGLTLKEAGLALGLVDAATFDRVVRPEEMLGR